ncbi:lysozyme, partial [Providencia rettgeri]
MKLDKSFWLFIMVIGLGGWVVSVHDDNKLLKKD